MDIPRYIFIMSLCACAIIPVVLLLRLMLKKAPKWINVLLWGIVALSLIVAPIIDSLIQELENEPTDPPYQNEITDPNTPLDPDPGENMQNPLSEPSDPNDVPPEQNPDDTNAPERILNYIKSIAETMKRLISDCYNAIQSNSEILIIWGIGAMSMLSYTAVSYWRLRRKVATAVRLIENIYQSENVGFPFVLGFFKPRIYLPFKIDLQDLEHVIAHEKAHIQRKDHWWKPLGFLLLSIQWFNPLMWLAYILLCRDIELACDEKVIRNLGNEQKADYTQALVTCSVKRHMVTACPLAFGALGVKDRVKAVMNYKKPTLWIKLVSVIVCIVVSISSLTLAIFTALAIPPDIVDHPVPGGSLQFDRATGTIVGYEGDPSTFEIPAKIDGVDVVAIADGNTVQPVPDGTVYYSVPGGGLLFVPATGSIIGHMGSPTEFEIPAEIDGVDVVAFANGNTTLPIPNGTIFYPVPGGGLLFVPATGSIIGYMGSPAEFEIPAEIAGVDVVAIADGDTMLPISSGTVYYPVPGGGLLFDSATGTIFDYMGSPTKIDIPAEIDGVDVVAIGPGALRYCGSLTSVTIAEGVDTIGAFAFAHCPNLTKINIPSSVRTIGRLAFRLCESLRSIDLPEGLESIGNEAFAYSGLTEITMPASVKTIGPGAFSMCSSLEAIWVDEDNPNYSSDENGVLFNKEKTELHTYPGALKGDYTIPSGIIKIGAYAFSGCSLSSVNIPNSVTVIGTAAFYHCSNLTSVTLPEGVAAIDNNAFSKCSSLTDITIPASMASIGNSVFSGCNNLTDIYYRGSAAQWKQLDKGSHNYNSAAIRYNAA